MPLPIIDIIIVNFNHSDDTFACIETLRHQEGVIVRILVIDNGSEDDSLIRLKNQTSDYQLIASPKNLGFASGYNLGMRTCLENGANLILIINNDTLADSNMLSEMVALMAPDVGLVAPIIYYAERPTEVWSQGGRMNWLLMEVIDNHGRNQPTPDLPFESDFLSGCCLLFNRKAIEKVGLLDEEFFLYYEDMDWSVRFQQAGYQKLVAPRAKLWHKVSRSSGGYDSPNERYWMARSSMIYFRKHVHGAAWLAVIPWRSGSAIKTSLRLVRSGRYAALKAFWKGLRDGLR